MQQTKIPLTDEEQANMQFLEIAGDMVMGATDHRKLIGSLVIPNGITEIGKFAFAFCSGLTRVTIPAGVTIIDQETFSACSSLTNVTLPRTVTVIGSAAFTCCFNLPAIVIPDSVIAICPFAFSTCRNLKTVTIESTIIKDIDETAFENVHAYIHFTVKTDIVKAMLKKNTAIQDEQITVEPTCRMSN